MNTPGRLVLKLLPLLIGTQVLPAWAQTSPAAPTAPQEAPPAPAAASAPQAEPEAKPPAPAATGTPAQLDRVLILGNAVGERQTRANVKITAADLDYYPPGVSADKVLERVSGIQVGSSNAFGGDGFESTINMRGFGKDSIGFSIDGIPNGRTTLGGGSVPTRYFDSSNLGGVDVSQSAGNIGSPSHQALVGHVNYVTQDPESRFGGRAEVAGGSAGYRRAYARIDSGELASGLTGYLSLSQDRWKVSYVSDPVGENRRDHIDLKLVKKLEGGGVLKLRSGYNDRQEESGTNIVTLSAFNANPKSDGYTDTWLTTGTAADIAANHRAYRGLKGNPRTDQLTSAEVNLPVVGSVTANAKAYYHTQHGIGKETGRGTALGVGHGLDGNADSVYFRANNYQMTRRGVLGELTGRDGDLLDWKLGVWGERYNRRQFRRWHPVSMSGPEYGDAVTTSEDKHWFNTISMVYAGNTSKLVDGRLKLEYGLSYMDNQVDYNAPIHDSATDRFNYVNEASVNSGVLPKIGAVFTLTPSTEVFGGYAKNAAAVTDATLEANANTTLATARTVKDMDTANAFDLGVRHKGDNFVVGAQAFLVRSTETVAADIPNSLQSQNVDQGRRIRGIELTYNGRLGDDWRLYGAYTFQKHRYELSNAKANGSPEVGFIRNGEPLVGIADQNAYVEATWRPAEDWKLAANGRFVSSRAGYYANPTPTSPPGTTTDQRLPGYALFGVNGSYTFKHGSVGLNIENLTDKAYISGIAPELMTQPSSVGRYFIGAPRTFILWLKLEM
jgi:iron complex outermembrane receptor protein